MEKGSELSSYFNPELLMLIILIVLHQLLKGRK